MKKLLPAAAVALALSACSSRDAPEPAPSETATPAPAGIAPGESGSSDAEPPSSSGPGESAMILRPAGLGALVIGKPPPMQGDGAWREDDVQISDACRTLFSDRYPESYAISDGADVRRVTIGEGSPVRTDRGIGPGSTEDQVRKAYPGIVATPHKYVGPPAKYLTWLPKTGAPGLRFETDSKGRVALVHAGVMPWLGYIEGCA